MDIQKNIAYNVKLLMNAHNVDITEMSKIIWCEYWLTSQRKSGKAPYRIQEIVNISNHFNVDLNLLIKWKLKVNVTRSVDISADMTDSIVKDDASS